MANSTSKTPAPAVRPPKPYKAFPLSPHANGKWQKKIGGKIFYFGFWARRKNGVLVPVDDADHGAAAAMREYEQKFPDGPVATAVRTTVESTKEEKPVTLGKLCYQFLASKNRKVADGRMKPRTFKDYKDTVAVLLKAIGKEREVESLVGQDFVRLASYFSKYGPARQANNVQRVRTVFKYGVENMRIKHLPKYGDELAKPGKAERRHEKRARGKRKFTQGELLTLLNGKTVTDESGSKTHIAGADPVLRAMILLGINCGLGNTDCAELRHEHLDLAEGWLDFPRPKTAVERRAPLWPETVDALRNALPHRPTPKAKGDSDLMFATPSGERFVRERKTMGKLEDGTEYVDKVVTVDAVSACFRKLLKRLGLNGRRGVGFYALRHTFRTVVDGNKDGNAARMMMGHVIPGIDGEYIEDIEDERLLDASNYVRNWLFSGEADA